MPTDKQTALQEFIENAKTAKDNSKDGFVTYEEVIEFATELLPKEKALMNECRGEGFDKGRNFEWESHFGSVPHKYPTKEEYLSQYTK